MPGRVGPLRCSLIHVLGKEHTLGMSHCRIVANQSSFESSRRKACCDIARAFRRNHFAHSQQLQGPVPLVRGKLRALPPLSHVPPPAGSGTTQGAIAALTTLSKNLRAGDSRTVLSAAAAGLGAVFSDEGLRNRDKTKRGRSLPVRLRCLTACGGELREEMIIRGMHA